MAFLVTTTGTVDPVVINDLGGRSIDHPTVDLDLETLQTIEEIANSLDLQASIDAGELTVTDGDGNPITDVTEAVLPHATETQRGIAEIATQAETDTGTDDARFVTPLKLASYSGLNGAGELAAASARRTTTLGGGTWQDVTFDATDVENDTAVVEHDNTNTDRITVKETGLYLVGYSFEVLPTGAPSVLEGRVRINDTTVVPQSLSLVQEDNEITNFNAVFVVELTANDFLTVQVQTSVGTETIQAGANFFVVRQQGTQGPTGPAGAGSTVIIQEEGSTVAGGPHDTLDFIGDGVVATNAGGGEATITVPGYYDAVVAPSGGDYTLPSAAFSAGKTRVWIRAGTYVENANNVVIPNGGVLHGAAGAVIVFTTGQLRVDGQARLTTAGTFSVTSGSASVTGSGTAFNTLLDGDYIAIGPAFYKISGTPGTATALTLAEPWRGPSRSGLPMLGQGMFAGVSLRGFTIMGSTAATGGLYLRGIVNSVVHQVAVIGCTHNVNVDYSGNFALIQVFSYNSTNDGLRFNNSRSVGATDCIFLNNTTFGANIIGAGVAMKFTNCEFSVNGSDGAFVGGTSTDTTFTGCGSKQNSGKGINTDPGTVRCIIDGCTIEFNAGVGIDFDGTENIVTASQIGNGGTDGMFLGANGQVSNCRVHNNAGNGLSMSGDDNCVVSDNLINNNGGRGIDVPSSDNCVIADNRIYNNTGNGINIAAASDNNRLSGNRLTGNGTDIVNNSTSTIFETGSIGTLLDNRLIKGDTTVPGSGVQASGITVDDSNNLTGVGTINGATPGTDANAIHKNVAAEISTVALKATPASGDLLLVEDSAAANAKKRITVGSLPGGGGKPSLAYSFGSGDSVVNLSSTDSSFTVKARFIFPGTTAFGAISAIKVIRSSDNCTGRIRIYDLTNAQTIVTSPTISSSTSSGILNLGTLANVPTGEAVFEVQMIRDSGTGGSAIRCSALVANPT